MTAAQKIIRAAKRRTGLRLTGSEVRALSRDTAIVDLAANDDQRDEQDKADKKADAEAEKYAEEHENNYPRCVW